MRIALTGSLYSGKTTLARYMEANHGWYHIDYTGLLKEYLAVALSKAYGRRVTRAEIEADKGRYRATLQNLGSALGFDQGFGVDKVLRRWKKSNQYVWSNDPSAMFDNVRFEAQFTELRKQGFVLVELHVPYEEQRRRANELGVGSSLLEQMRSHHAEDGVSPELVIDANRPVEEIADILLRLDGLTTIRSSRLVRVS